MQTLVYLRPPKKVLEAHAKPEFQDPANVIRRVTTATIRGVDLLVRAGDVPSRKRDRILDNEDTGFVDKMGPAFIGF